MASSLQLGEETSKYLSEREVPNIVLEWLSFLKLDQYSKEFIDNGYDDLETVKKIGPADLDAIGVMSAHHRAFLLDAVRVLKEQGAAWVYLLLGESSHNGDVDEDHVSASSGIASGTSSQPWLEEQELSVSSCDCDSSFASRRSRKMYHKSRSRINKHRIAEPVSIEVGDIPDSSFCSALMSNEKQSFGSPSSRESHSSIVSGYITAYRPIIGYGGNRTPSIGQSCLTETTDCPSDVSVITSISATRFGERLAITPKTSPTSSVWRDDLPSRPLQSTSDQDDQPSRLLHSRSEEDLIQRLQDSSTFKNESQTKIELQDGGSSRFLSKSPKTLRNLVKERLKKEDISLSSHPYTQSTGDSRSYLASLAASIADEIQFPFPHVLTQLEDIRLAEWSDQAPPPPWNPRMSKIGEARKCSHQDYANYPQNRGPYVDDEPIYQPGAYAPSSCLTDGEGDDIYDFAAKYRAQMRSQHARMLMTPQGWIQIAKKIISKSKKDQDFPTNIGSSQQCSKQINDPQPSQTKPLYKSESDIRSKFYMPRASYGTERTFSSKIGKNNLQDERHSPEVQMYKTRVIYHSKHEGTERCNSG